MIDTLQALYDYRERCGIAGKDIALQQISDNYGFDRHFMETINRMGGYAQAGHALGAHKDIDYIKTQLRQHQLEPSVVAIKRVGAYYVVYSKIPTHKIPWVGWQNLQF